MKKGFKDILKDIDFDDEQLSEGHIHHIVSRMTTERKTKTKKQKVINIKKKHKNKYIDFNDDIYY